MRAGLTVAAAVAGTLVLAGCQGRTEAPYDPGVCWHVVIAEGEEPRFNKVADNQPSIEECAARLEEVRTRFVRFGSQRREMIGAYQGRFLFLDSGGVSFGESLEGSRFVALARTRDGRLVVPGAIEQPPPTSQPRQ